MRCRLDPGTLLVARGEPWVLTHSAVYGDCVVLSLEGRGESNRAERICVIEPCEPAEAEMVYVSIANEAAMLWFAVTFENV